MVESFYGTINKLNLSTGGRLYISRTTLDNIFKILL